MKGYPSFYRKRDFPKIEQRETYWKGPFSWPKYENETIPEMPDLEGVYLFTLPYKDSFILANVGITKSTKKRFYQHTSIFKKGGYTILDMDAVKNGERKELWHGWEYAKSHREEFENNKKSILEFVDKQLSSYRIFIMEEQDNRIRKRIEASIALHAYLSQEDWADIIDRGMFLTPIYNSEIPICLINHTNQKIYGLPDIIEI